MFLCFYCLNDLVCLCQLGCVCYRPSQRLVLKRGQQITTVASLLQHLRGLPSDTEEPYGCHLPKSHPEPGGQVLTETNLCWA